MFRNRSNRSFLYSFITLCLGLYNSISFVCECSRLSTGTVPSPIIFPAPLFSRPNTPCPLETTTHRCLLGVQFAKKKADCLN
jgi:hypothetical protein